MRRRLRGRADRQRELRRMRTRVQHGVLGGAVSGGSRVRAGRADRSRRRRNQRVLVQRWRGHRHEGSDRRWPIQPARIGPKEPVVNRGGRSESLLGELQHRHGHENSLGRRLSDRDRIGPRWPLRDRNRRDERLLGERVQRGLRAKSWWNGDDDRYGDSDHCGRDGRRGRLLGERVRKSHDRQGSGGRRPDDDSRYGPDLAGRYCGGRREHLLGRLRERWHGDAGAIDRRPSRQGRTSLLQWL